MSEVREKYVRQCSERELAAKRKLVEALRELKEMPETGHGNVVIEFDNFEVKRTKSTKERLW